MIKLLQLVWSCPNNDKFTPGWIRLNVPDTQIPTCQCRTCLFLRLSNEQLVFKWACSLMEQFVPYSPPELHLSADVVWILRFWFRQISSKSSSYGEQISPYVLLPIGTVFFRRWRWYHLCRVDNKLRWQVLTWCCAHGGHFWELPAHLEISVMQSLRIVLNALHIT